MATVFIGCKLPNGIILELVPEQPKDVKEQKLHPAPPGPRVTLKGANSLRTDRRAAQPMHPYAITAVDKSFWDKWIGRAENKALDFIKSGLVFDATSEQEAAGKAKERMGLKTGLEPLAQKDDPRLPKGRSPQTTVEADAEQPLGRESRDVAVA